MSFSLSISVTFFLITAKGMKNPDDYTRYFSFETYTLFGVTISKAYSSLITTYGVGFSWEVGVNPVLSVGNKTYGGIIALILDFCDGKLDKYFTFKFN